MTTSDLSRSDVTGDLSGDETPGEAVRFVRGNDQLARLLADPDTSAEVTEARGQVAEMDRAHAMSLAMIRKAGELTQVEVAQRLGVGQGVVSRLENRDDMLLSTLHSYLTAAGAVAVHIVVTMRDQQIDLDLATLRTARAGEQAGP